MEPLPRVVGSPRHGQLLGAKSREALTNREHRRSGHWSPLAMTPAAELMPAAQVDTLSVPSDEAKRQCGVPTLSSMCREVIANSPELSAEYARRQAAIAPPQMDGPTLPYRDREADGRVSPATTDSSAPSAIAITDTRRTLWQRLCAWFRCLSRR